MPQALRNDYIALWYTSPSVLWAAQFAMDYIKANCPNSPLYIGRTDVTVDGETQAPASK